MKLKTLSFTVLIYCLAALEARSQDVVITDKGDTVRCKLSHSMMGAYKYKAPNGTSVDITMKNTREFYTENKKMWVRRLYITSQRIPCFLDVVLTGKLNLYEMGAKHVYYNGSLTYSRETQGADAFHQRLKTQYFVAKSDTAEVVMDDDLSRSKSKDLLDEKFVPFIQDNAAVLTLYRSENHVSADDLKKLVALYDK